MATDSPSLGGYRWLIALGFQSRWREPLPLPRIKQSCIDTQVSRAAQIHHRLGLCIFSLLCRMAKGFNCASSRWLSTACLSPTTEFVVNGQAIRVVFVPDPEPQPEPAISLLILAPYANPKSCWFFNSVRHSISFRNMPDSGQYAYVSAGKHLCKCCSYLNSSTRCEMYKYRPDVTRSRHFNENKYRD